MQGREFSGTIRTSASDSIILKDSVRNGKERRRCKKEKSKTGEGEGGREMWRWLFDEVLEVPQWTVMGQVEGSVVILGT